ncbi:P-loop containing nucleoside triphosphate hydrolase protein, partial [Clathrospora elynae]
DIVEGKGQGLVILLHGLPGVGKTLKAEMIAIVTGRPLLTVSVADIGIEYQQAETNLTEIFVDAARWEAVLLMDKADVFVEERRKRELHHNALVSVLLRCIEYFNGNVLFCFLYVHNELMMAGIIIITANRVRSIDAAILSRIQLAIQYHDLKPSQRGTIYLDHPGAFG